MDNRTGKRKPRGQMANMHVPRLGYYFIVTDTEETERNYMNGLRNSIPSALQDKLVIRVIPKTKTRDLVSEAENMAALHPQYAEPWIVVDRDKVKEFDQIIDSAEKRDIKIGWSNPCIEVWFNAYFGKMPMNYDSVKCNKDFGIEYLKKTRQVYKKNDKNIYSTLLLHGDEKKAIEIAEKRYCEKVRNSENEKNCKLKPSEMYSCTTLHILLKEIKEKIKSSKDI